MVITMDKGLIHIYMGGGKGKTTSAMGLAMRCHGSGKCVYVVQFLKTSPTGEVNLIEAMQRDDFKVFRFETQHGFFPQMNAEQRVKLQAETEQALGFIAECMKDGKCDMLVLDEVLGAAENGLISASRLIDIMHAKPKNMELVLTGRIAPHEVIAAADYVTEMVAHKHPYEQGIPARKGIEY